MENDSEEFVETRPHRLILKKLGLEKQWIRARFYSILYIKRFLSDVFFLRPWS